MAAPSVGRRSCAGQREAAALITQSRRWSYGRVKRAAGRRLFFLCRRPAAISTYYVRKKSLRFNVSFLPYKNCPRHSSCKTGYYMTNQYRNPNPV